jgi:hypothetical protein
VISKTEHCVPLFDNLNIEPMKVAFYLDVLEKSVRTGRYEQQDWDKIWRETRAVTPEEWEALKASLRESYDRIQALVHDTKEWSNERQIGGAIATIVHTAYHLGEIRQALCTVRQQPGYHQFQGDGLALCLYTPSRAETGRFFSSVHEVHVQPARRV